MKIGTYLEQLGFSHHMHGFNCAEEAIRARMDGYDGKTAVLYSKISRQNHCDAQTSIYHAMRAAMKVNPDFIRMLGLPEYRQGSKMTALEFICTAAYRLKEMEEAENAEA